MAELAIPLIGLGFLYVISNKDNKNNKENYTNMGKPANQSQMPLVDVPIKNFPVESKTIDPNNTNYTRQYLNPNQTTDKFFNNKTSTLQDQNYQQTNSFSTNNLKPNSKNNFESLSGNSFNKSDFKHNNMVPFFGSKVKGPSVDSIHSQSILDNHQGAGHHSIKKVEQAPLFKPDDSVQFTHGAPNSSDFIQSRQLPSTKNSNVLPWKQEQVGPGLGLGSTTEGMGGFNSGMLDRDAWAPPTVDQLRVKTNPKETYGLYGHEGPLNSKVQNSGIQGTVEKNRPTKDFEIGPQRWFTSTGASVGQTSIPEHIIPDGNRNSTSNQYFGVSANDGNSKGTYTSSYHEPSSRPELCATEINPASAVGQGSANNYDYGRKGYNLLNNNRHVNCQENSGSIGGINGAFKAMVAPIVDALRPSRKENVICNANSTGNVAALVPNLPITNPDNKVKTTIKETTSDKVGLNYLNVSHISVPEGGYQSTEVQVKEQERNKCDSSSMGFVGGPSTYEAQMSVGAWENQHNNVNKTYENWPMQGGMSMLNNNTNLDIGKKDTDRVNNRLQTPDFIIPKHDQMINSIPSLDSYGKINLPQQYSQEVNAERINPDMLSAFKNNPYAQSVTNF